MRGPTIPISQEVHQTKYRLDGESFEQCVYRLANGLKDGEEHRKALKDILGDMRFLPGGRVQCAIGSPRETTAFNCFVSGSIDDSMDSIMRRATEAAETMRRSGGIGYDFSQIRPRGELIKSLQSKASGPVSFMRIYDAVCHTIASAGHRRGAQMGVLRCLGGGTLVHTLDGLIPIRDLVGTRPYVYACDSITNAPHVVQADRVFISDRNRKVVKVTLDSLRTIECTPDHQFMLADGLWREAGDLQVGDSLKAIKHAINQHGNSKRFVRTVGVTGGKAEYEHRVVARDVLGLKVDQDHHVHHIDENSLNNTPSNLQSVSKSEHAKLHSSNLRTQQRLIADRRRGRTRAEVYGSEKARLWEERRLAPRQQTIPNHKVVSVEEVGVACEVYDISLPQWHNFAAEEIFLHNCDHPDIERFVRAKQDNVSLQSFNVSVAVTDEFMQCLQSGEKFSLRYGGDVYSLIDPEALWDEIMRSTWDWAEPGVLFIDTINRLNNLRYYETIYATNP